MKYKYTNIYEWTIYLILLLNLGLLNVDKDHTVLLSALSGAISVALFLVYLSSKNKISNFWINVSVIFIIGLYTYNIISTSLGWNTEVTTTYAISNDSGYLMLLVCFPFACVLRDGNPNFLRNIARLGLLALLLKNLIWLLYNFAHIKVFPGYFFSDTWYRTFAGASLLRMQGTFLDTFTFSYYCSEVFSKQKNSFKVRSILSALYVLFYNIAIYQSRAVYIAMIFSLIAWVGIVLFKSHDKFKNIFLAIVAIALIVFIFKDQINSVISSFDATEKSDTSGSTLMRQYALQYYSSLWHQHNLWLGMGLSKLEGTFNIYYNVYLADIGLTAYLFEYGFVGMFFFSLPLLVGLGYIISKNINMASRVANIFILLLFDLLIQQISLNMYWVGLVGIVPIYMGILLFLLNNPKKGSQKYEIYCSI